MSTSIHKPKIPGLTASESEDRTSVTLALGYLIASVPAALLYSMWVFTGPAFSGPSSPGTMLELPLKLLFLAMVAMSLKYRTGGVLLLLILTDLLIREPGGFQTPDLFQVVAPLLPLLLLIMVARFRSCQEAAGRRGFRGLFAFPASRQPLDVAAAAIMTCVRNSVVCVLAAWMILTMIAPDVSAVQDVRLRPNVHRAIMLGLMLTSIWLVVSIILNHVAWRKLSSGQSRVYLRGTYLHWIHRDLRLIVRRRLKLRRMASRETNRPVDLTTRTLAKKESGYVAADS